MLYSNLIQELIHAFGNVGIMRSWEEYDAYQTAWLQNLPETYIAPVFGIIQNPAEGCKLTYFDQEELLYALEQTVCSLAKRYPTQLYAPLSQCLASTNKIARLVAIGVLGYMPAAWAEPYIEQLINSKLMTYAEIIALIDTLIESASLHKLEYLHQIETDNKFSRYTNTECEAIQREIKLIRTSIAEQQHPPMQ